MRSISLPILLLPALTASAAPFADLAPSLGLDFRHDTGAAGEYQFPEINGAGAALVDFDDDGDLDAFLVQSGPLTRPEARGRDRLFRNDLADGGGFVDVTERLLPEERGYGVGVAAGDVNGDGWVDLYVTNVGADQLLVNDGGRRFVDGTEGAGLGLEGWSTSASFFDADGDGDLDLYVARYVVYDAQENPRCHAGSSRRDYCGPGAFQGALDRFYLNDGLGHFSDATLAALGAHPSRPGLGVLAADFDDDGDLDVYVANDGAPNHLWINDGRGRFEDEALFSGVAVNGSGRPEASMGIAAADYDHDGDLDLLLTHLMGESNTLYRNGGRLRFGDVTEPSGLGASSFPYTGWGTAFVDLDFDGWLEPVVFNGAVRTIVAQIGTPWPFLEPNQAWRSVGGKRFEEFSADLGADFRRPLSARGVAFGDVDNDGDIDFLVNNAQGPAQLLVSRGRPPAPWLGVRLPGAATAQPAMVALKAGGSIAWRRSARDGSYASAGDPRVLFHVPGQTPPFEIVLRAGGRERIAHVMESDRYVELELDDPRP